MNQNEKRANSACKTIVFSHEMCRFVAFSFSPSSLRKVPTVLERDGGETNQIVFCTCSCFVH